MRLCASSKATVAAVAAVAAAVVAVAADVAVAVAVAAAAAADDAAAAVVEFWRAPRWATNAARWVLGGLPLGGGRPGRTDWRAGWPATPYLCPR